MQRRHRCLRTIDGNPDLLLMKDPRGLISGQFLYSAWTQDMNGFSQAITNEENETAHGNK